MNLASANIVAPSEPRTTAKSVALLVVITLFALAARLYRIDAESLFIDELQQVSAYSRTLPDVLKVAAKQGQPPLDYLIGAALHRLGLAGSDAWVRVPAALFGAGSVFLLGWWVTRFAGATAGLLSALLLSVCPLHLAMSQEARPYTIYLWASLATALLYLRARRSATRSAWCLFIVALAATLLSRGLDPHFLTAALAAWATTLRIGASTKYFGRAIDHERRAFRFTFASIAIAYLLAAPALWMSSRTLAGATGSVDEPWLQRVGSQLADFISAVFLGYSEQTLSALPGPTAVVAVGALTALVGLGFLAARARPGEARLELWLFLACFFAAPLCFAGAYTALAAPHPKPQYLLPLAATIVVSIAALAASFLSGSTGRWRGLRHVTAIATIAVAASPMVLRSATALTSEDKRDWRGMLGFLGSHSSSEDAFIAIASDTVPPCLHAPVLGVKRYAHRLINFLQLNVNADVNSFDDSWERTDRTVWVVVHRDRFSTGTDQLPPPVTTSPDMSVHAFRGFYILEIRGHRPARERVALAMTAIYEELPSGRSLVGPAVFLARRAIARGDAQTAHDWLSHAVRQCRDEGEIALAREAVEAAAQCQIALCGDAP